MKKLLSCLIMIAVLMSTLTVSIYAYNLSMTTTRITVDDETMLLSNEALEEVTNITAEEAGYIAELFITDMIKVPDCAWDDGTEIVNIVTMYDKTGTSATAYSIELTEGYVIVSAYADAETLIPEWSDASTPIYASFDDGTDGLVVYLGGYEYYKQYDNSKLVGIDGNLYENNELINNISLSRNTTNIPVEVLEQCSNYAPMYDFDPGTYPIIDPIIHCENLYGGTFTCSDYCNNWERYIDFFTIKYGYCGTNTWEGGCGPVAITNMILAFQNRHYDESEKLSATTIMDTVATYGNNNDYYDAVNGGTYNSTAATYILNAIRLFGINSNVVGWYSATYDNVKRWLTDNDLLYVHVRNASYDNHLVMSYAYTRLINSTGTIAKTFLKVADGLCTDGRYIDILTVTDDAGFLRVEMWR